MAMALASPRATAPSSTPPSTASTSTAATTSNPPWASTSGAATAVSGSSSSAPGGFAQGALPEDFPETLIPPDSTIGVAGDFGVGIAVEFTSTATLNTVIEFYKDELGNPMLSSSDGTLRSDIDGTKATSVTISGSDGDVEIIVTSATP